MDIEAHPGWSDFIDSILAEVSAQQSVRPKRAHEVDGT